MLFVGLVLIGCIATTPQVAAGQSSGDDDSWIDAADRRYVARFRELLLADGVRDVAAGWELAEDVGRPVVPVLWRLVESERSNVDKRLALMVAALVAGGPAEDARLFSFLEKGRPMLPERVMASLWIALGAERARPRPDALSRLLGPNREPEDLLAVAVRLAAARFPGADENVAQIEERDPGVLAAAVFAGMPVAKTSAHRQWRGDHRDAGLYQRAALLGAARRYERSPPAVDLLALARSSLAGDDAAFAEVRDASLLLLARADDLRLTPGDLDWRQLQLAISQEASRASLRAHLRAEPYARDAEPHRLAVAYALWRPIEQVVEERAIWSKAPAVRAHVAVALAARLCALKSPPAITDPLPGCPEWSFVVWACGGAAVGAQGAADSRLATLGRLLSGGRVSRRAAKEELEMALWRWGSHPRVGVWRAERQLIRDLLLVGSRSGARYQPERPPHLRYFATGLDRDDSFFDLASALYEFTRRPRTPVPLAHRIF